MSDDQFDMFKRYRQITIKELRPYSEGEDMTGINVGDVDKAAGSPRVGDMIARNPANHSDQWLVAQAYFEQNFEPVT